MTITLEIKPAVQEALSRQASAQGLDLSAYASGLLEEAAHEPEVKMPRPIDLNKTLQDLAQFSHRIPQLTDEAFSRESLYREHD